MISATEAERCGLVNRVVPSEKLNEETEAWALRIADASLLVLRLGKKAFYEQIEMEESGAYAYATQVITLNALAADAQEGMKAFLEKRRPVWQDR
jgi:enoyl-CoA hydratase/carnithine racemase